MAGVDADGDPGRDLLPARAAPDRVRADRRGGARMTASSSGSLRRASSRASRGSRRPTGSCGCLDARRSAGSALRLQRPSTATQLASLTRVAARRRGRRADRDRRGGRRRHAPRGGVAAARIPATRRSASSTTRSSTEAVAAVDRRPSSRPSASTSNFAPVADVNVDPANPVIGVRSFGADPELVARHVAAFVARAAVAPGVAACAKHFPGHGATEQDSHLELPTVDGRRRATASLPFRAGDRGRRADDHDRARARARARRRCRRRSARGSCTGCCATSSASTGS